MLFSVNDHCGMIDVDIYNKSGRKNKVLLNKINKFDLATLIRG